jgi:hypothetical protein
MVALLNTSPRMAIASSEAYAETSAAKTGAERRAFPRKELHARIEGKRIDHTLVALREPLMELALRDLSVGGLSAISPAPLLRGERLSITFPAQAASGSLYGSWDTTGRVVRCDASGLGYRVAVEFDSMPAAA